MNQRVQQPKRAVWQRLLRGVLLAGLMLVLAYVFLPWWLPSGWLQSHLEARLSRELGLTVQIGDVDCSWARVKIRDLEIRDPLTGERLAAVEEIRSEFSPMRVMMGEELRWMELRRAELHVDWAIGQANPRQRPSLLDALLREKDSRGMLNVRRITVRGAEVRIHAPGLDRQWLAQVGELQLYRGTVVPVSRLSFTSRLVQPGDDAMIVGRLQHHKAEGALQLAAIRLDLAELPLEKFGIQPGDVKGEATLRVSLQMGENLHVNRVGVILAVNHLDAKTPQGRIRAPQAELACTAMLPAGDGVAEVTDLTLSMPGVTLAGKLGLDAGVVVGDKPQIRHATLAGTFDPAPIATMIGTDVLATLQMDQPATVELHTEKIPEGLRVIATADASSAAIRWDKKIVKPAGRTVRLATAIEQRSDGWQLRPSRLDFGENVVMLNRVQQVPMSSSEFRGTIFHGTADLADLVALRDVLGPAADSIKPLEGAIRATWSFVDSNNPHDWDGVIDRNFYQLKAELLSSRSETLRLGEILHKPVGGELAMNLALWFGRDGVRLANTTLGYAGAQAKFKMRSTGKGNYDGSFKADHIERLLSCWPLYAKSNVELRGSIEAGGEMSGENLAATINLKNTQIRWPGVWYKPLDESMTVQLEAKDASRMMTINAPNATMIASAKEGESLAAEIRCDDVAKLASRSKAVAQLFATPPSGKFTGYVALAKPASDDWTATGELQLYGKGRLADRLGGFLLVGNSVALSGRASARKIDVKFKSPGATISASGGFSRAITPEALGKLATLDVLKTVTFDGSVASRVVLGSLPPQWINPVLRTVAGPIKLSGALQLDPVPTGTIHALATLSGSVGGVKLRPDRPLEMEVKLHPGKTKTTSQLAATVSLPGLSAEATATVFRKDDALSLADLAGKASMNHRIAGLLPPVAIDHLQGRGELTFASRDPASGVMDTLSLSLEKTTMQYHELPLSVSGSLNAQSLNIATGEFAALIFKSAQCNIGGGQAVFDGHLAYQNRGLSGTLSVLADKIDIPAIRKKIPAAAGSKARISPMETQAAATRAKALLAKLVPFAKSSDVKVDLVATRCVVPDERFPSVYPVDKLVASTHLAKGKLTARYQAGLLGGTAQMTADIDFAAEHPVLKRKKTIDRIKITDAVAPQITWDFPGNTPAGQLSRTESLRGDMKMLLARWYDSRMPVIYVGEATMTATKGVLVGAAAPPAVTRVFPGLNLAKYDYASMHVFTKYDYTGAQQNEVFFRGKYYNLYSTGTTTRGRVVDYTMGLVLLPASPDSVRFHREWKQGRVPLLRLRARIADSKFIDPKVTHPWTNESLAEVFLTNNLLYRAWQKFNAAPAKEEK